MVHTLIHMSSNNPDSQLHNERPGLLAATAAAVLAAGSPQCQGMRWTQSSHTGLGTGIANTVFCWLAFPFKGLRGGSVAGPSCKINLKQVHHTNRLHRRIDMSIPIPK